MLDKTDAKNTGAVVFNSLAPTSSVINVGTAAATNGSTNDMIAYCWSEVSGFSKFGSYTGSSSGVTVTTGFRPQWIMFKCSSTDNNYTFWEIVDDERPNSLAADLSDQEGSYNLGTGTGVTFLDNGFEVTGSGSGKNLNGQTYVYAAFAGTPPGEIIDSLIDTPTDADTPTDTGAGGEVVGNYATLNPLASGGVTLSNGNLDVSISTSDPRSAVSTISASSGKWYAEYTCTAGNQMMVGVVTDQYSPISGTTRAHAVSSGGGSVAYHASTGNKRVDTANSSYGATYGNGDVIGIALNLDDDEITFYKNGSSQGTITSKPFAGGYTFFASNGGSTQTQGITFNFGQRPFAYTAPSGFKALCTTNLPDPTIADGSTAFNTVLYTGNGSTQSITGVNHSPDLVWIKCRSASKSNSLFDSVRGATKLIKSNETQLETTQAGGVTSFDSDGFSIGNRAGNNENNASFVAWAWDGGTSTVSNTDGSLTASVRANPSAGFSIVNWVGNGNAETVGHGLGVAPVFYILRPRNVVTNWNVYTTLIDGSHDYLYLQSTGGAGNSGLAAPTSSVLNRPDASGNDMIAYCFAPVEGYSAFGTYTGNGSTNGPFVYTGFRPAFLLVKAFTSGSAEHWYILDSVRNTSNVVDNTLFPSLSNAEDTDPSNNFDFLSNGFKLKNTNAGFNHSGRGYLYYAVAENPFKTARAR